VTDQREDRIDWRPIIAVFANDDMRTVAIHAMTGGDVERALAGYSPSRRRHITAGLRKSGIVTMNAGRMVFDRQVFTRLLRQERSTPRAGMDRFLRRGRIAGYPASPVEREALLRSIAHRILTPGETISEAEINERLEAYTDDVAVLRRYLVDFALVERRRDGSEYALCSGPA